MITSNDFRDMRRAQLRPARVADPTDVTPADVREAKRASTKMLLAISATGKHLYQGTVPAHVKARRRAANKVARKARRAAR